MKNQPFTASLTPDYAVHSESADAEALKLQPKTIKLSNGLLAVGGGNIEVAGNTISRLTDGLISNVEITKIDGVIYTYQIIVTGRGGFEQGGYGWYFAFGDMTGDTYNLSVLSPVIENHYVDYNSREPAVTEIVIGGYAKS